MHAVRSDNEQVKQTADQLYAELQNRGLEVMYDDRSVSAGVMFSDADLLGVPVRVVVSPRNLKNECCEVVTRDKRFSDQVSVVETADHVQQLVNQLFRELQPIENDTKATC